MSTLSANATLYPARLATNVGWVRGSLILPERQRVLDVLNGHDGLLRLVDTFLPARKEHMEFFAVRVGSVSLVLPGATTGDQRQSVAEARAAIAAAAVPQRKVLLLLDKVSVKGTVAMVGKNRVSDLFTGARSFVRVEGASLQAERGGGQSDLIDHFPEVFVNVARVHGIADVDSEEHAEAVSATRVPRSQRLG
jgi:hypothetical protein